MRDFNFAARIQGEDAIRSTLAYIPWENSNNFSCLVHYFERMMETGNPDYPIERTLLTSGTLDFLMCSRREEHKHLETPELNVTYQPCGVGLLQGRWILEVPTRRAFEEVHGSFNLSLSDRLWRKFSKNQLLMSPNPHR